MANFTFLRFIDAAGVLVWHVVHAGQPLGIAYRTGPGGRVWRVIGVRGAYRTRHAAAAAALAHRGADRPAPGQWATPDAATLGARVQATWSRADDARAARARRANRPA